MRRAALLLCSLLMTMSPTLASGQWSHNPSTSLTLPGATVYQQVDAALADGNGGAYLIYEDARLGSVDIYAHHLLASGKFDPAWPANGLAVCTAAGTQSNARAMFDASGAIVLLWNDVRSGTSQIFASRILTNGTLAPNFPANGLALDTSHPNLQSLPQLALEPGGTYVAIFDYTAAAANHDVYLVRFNSSGIATNLVPIATAAASETAPVMVVMPNGDIDIAFISAGTSVRFVQLNSALSVTSTGLATATFTSVTTLRACTSGSGEMVAGVLYNNAGTPTITQYLFSASGLGSIGTSQITTTSFTLGDMVYLGDHAFALGFTQSPSSVYMFQTNRNSGIAYTFTISSHGGGIAPLLVGDGKGGAAGAYYFNFLAANSYAFRATSLSTGPALFNAPDGVVAIAPGTGFAVPTAVCSDGNQGVYVFSRDASSPQHALIAHVDRWGALNGEPTIASVKDVAGDQGGKVRIVWNASYLDEPLVGPIGSYWIWRQVPVTAAQARLARGTAMYHDGDTPVPGMLRLEREAANGYAWEFVASQAANGFAQYSYLASTAADSSSYLTAKTVFMVEARHATVAIGWPSLPDSGYSVDNLPPLAPAPFTGQYGAGVAHLHWAPNAESDFATYLLYRGTSSSFATDAAHLVASVGDTGFVDPAAAPAWYKLVALDTHGNVSPPSTLLPAGTLDAGDAAPRAMAFALASQNPSRGGAVLRFALPQAGDARIALYDVHGRLVRELARGAYAAGEYRAAWDGRDASGARAGDGVYFARMIANGRTLEVRFVQMQ